MTKLFLTGYEKETLGGFLSKLKKSGVKAVLDVREIPLSRKNGFSKTYLKKRLSAEGIKYYHFQKLGSDYKSRRQLRTKGNNYDYLDFFIDYRNDLEKEKDTIKEIYQIISQEEKSALLCFEKKSELCHRSIVASALLTIDKSIKIIQI